MLATLLTNNKIQRATHNMMAYRIHISDRNTYLQVNIVFLQGLALRMRLYDVHVLCHRLLVTREGLSCTQ